MSYINRVQIQDVYYDVHDKRFVPGFEETSLQFGEQSTAGALGWYYKDFTWVSVGIKFTLTLCDEAGEPISPTEVVVDDEFSFKADYSANFCGKVFSISGSSLTGVLYNSLPNNWAPLDHEYDDIPNSRGYLWIPTKPSAGVISIGQYAISVGYNNKANELVSSAFGYSTLADGIYSHAEGLSTTSSGLASHAEGESTTASGDTSHAEGIGTVASSPYQHVQGKYNYELGSSYIDIIGWGSKSGDVVTGKNLSALNTSGDLRLKGDAYVGCNDDSTGGSKLATESSVSTKYVRKENEDPTTITAPQLNLNVIDSGALEITADSVYISASDGTVDISGTAIKANGYDLADLLTAALIHDEVATDALASMPDGAKGFNAEDVTVSIPSGSPTVTSLTVWANGVNNFDEEVELGGYDHSDGTPLERNDRIRSKNYIPVKPSTTYYYKNATNDDILFYDADKNFISATYKTNTTFNTPANARFLRISFNSAYGTVYQNDTSLNYPSTITNYNAYNGTKHTVDLGVSVSEGTLDLTTGDLTVVSPEAGTYTLTPVAVPIKQGQNNIIADVGTTAVKYVANTKLYIDKQ